jgi:diguanylate cyclase (GGDEF)-like protein/PAS domain S-box-containing protein
VSFLFRLMILAALSVLPSAMLEAWRAAEDRQEILSEVPSRALRQAELAAAEQRRIVEGASQLLTALSMLPIIRDKDAARCGPTMRRLREQFPAYTLIGVAGPDGRIWCSSSGTPDVDVSDSAAFRRAVEAEGFIVSGYLLGRSTGRRVLSFSMPIHDRDGRLAGVLTAGLDLERLAADLARTEMPPGATLTVTDPDGTVLVDLPSGKRVGQGLPERLLPILRAVRSGVADTEWIDGVRHVVAYVPTTAGPGASFLVAFGLNHEQFMGDARRRGARALAISAVVLAVALLVAWFFASRFIRRPIARLTVVAGRWRQGDLTARAGQIDQGSEIGQLGRAFDAMAEAVAERERRLTDMLESTTDAVWAFDRDWRVTYLNRRAQARMKRYDLLGRSAWDAFPDLEGGPAWRAFHRAMDERVPVQVTFFYAPLAGHFEANIFPSPDGGVTLFMREVTDEVRAQEALRHLAYHDPLTGLPNRRGFDEMAAQGVEGRMPTALVLLDLDGFKHVNDTLGHHAGDEVLRDAASRLAGRLGERGRLARLGGDEFAALLFGGKGPAAGEAIAEDMLAVVEERPFPVRGRQFRITASAGLVCVPPGQAADPQALLANADLALSRAKGARGGVCRSYRYADRAAYEARRQLEDELGRAAEKGEFELHYQPQVRLEDGALVGAEALLRWRHPTAGLLGPGLFLEALECSRDARAVGDWIVNEACRQAAVWLKAGLRLRLGVNLFGEQLKGSDLAEVIEAALERWGLPPERLELELTENIALRQDKEETLAPLRALRARGVGIAFDDFGTGFASLTTLRNFPLTRLKIDRSFISGLPEAAHDAAIVEAVLVLARSLGLEVIAEGVETEAQVEFLASAGCLEGQGYLFGRPMPAEEFLAKALARGTVRGGSEVLAGMGEERASPVQALEQIASGRDRPER